MLVTHISCTNIEMSMKLKKLNKDFENVYDWFIDNKLGIHFGEDKTKSILFTISVKSKVQEN